MPRQTDNTLLQWEDQIRVWVDHGWTHQQMRETIEEATGISISRSTWIRRCRDMNISLVPPVQDSPELRARIAYIFSALRLTDADTIDILTRDGFILSPSALIRIRRDMGLRKSTRATNSEEMDQQLRELLRSELDTNNISGYGKGNLYTYMRSKYNVVRRCVFLSSS